MTEAPRGLDGPTKIPGTINFECTRPASAPDGMDGNGGKLDSDESRASITDAILIEVKNTNSSAPI